MKKIFFSIFMMACFLQGLLMAQPQHPKPAAEANLEAKVERAPKDQPIQRIEETLIIIKPDAVRNNHVGEIISRFERAGLRVGAIKMVKLNQDQVAEFYKVHRDRPFFSSLVNFISSGPVVAIVLEGNQAISKARQLMGATDPSKADRGTIRAEFGESVTQNAVHGSDSPETAREEILFFFQPNKIYFRF